MRPTQREWLGAGILSLVLVVLLVLLVMAALPGGDQAVATMRALS